MILYSLLSGIETPVRIIRGNILYSDGSFLSPTEAAKLSRSSETKRAVGYAITDKRVASLRRVGWDTWSESKRIIEESDPIPGLVGYLPSYSEVIELYDLIMEGRMMNDIVVAGLYGECNYRYAFSSDGVYGPISWGSVWTSTEADEDKAYVVEYSRYFGEKDKNEEHGVIPFYADILRYYGTV